MSARFHIASLVTVVAVGAGALAATAGSAGSARLVSFRSCGDFLGYAKAHASKLVGPYGLGGPVAVMRGQAPSAAASSGATAGVDYSSTNVQEEGVDEPDIVKTDGATLFTATSGNIESVDVGRSQPRLLDTLKLDTGWSQDLLLHGDRLLVIARIGMWATPMSGVAANVVPYGPLKTVLTEVDVSNPKALRVVDTLTFEGSYVAARLVGSAVRVVVSSQMPDKLAFRSPDAPTSAAQTASTARNRRVVQASHLASWLPTYRLQRPGHAAGAPHYLVQCRNVARPRAFSGLGMLTVLTLDLDKGLTPVDSTGVLTDGRIVYASPTSLYVATEPWAVRPEPSTPTEPNPEAATTIHRFDISSATRTSYRGSGTVTGYLLDQWSLSEYDGVLRVVSTMAPSWWGPGDDAESFLTTLRLGPNGLAQAGRVGGLGRGERVYATRFVGTTAYVVTFKQIDPLQTVDVSDPEHPRVLGELKIPGYSAYLHPVAPDRLLGIGQSVDDLGHPLGTQLSLFDVSNLRTPARIAHTTLGPRWSEAESDHHAFLFWPATGLVVVPFDQRAVGYRVTRSGISYVGRIDQGTKSSGVAPIRRAVVVGDNIFTVSDAGVESSGLATLSPQGWAAFPRANPVPAPNVR